MRVTLVLAAACVTMLGCSMAPPPPLPAGIAELSLPSDALVPELFDVLTSIAPRMEAGAISPAWGSYLYTSYQQDMLKERRTGTPRRARTEVERAVEGYVEFYRLRARDGRKPRTIEDAAFEDTRAWRDERRIDR